MTRTLHILQKDARRLWPQALVFVALLVPSAYVDSIEGRIAFGGGMVGFSSQLWFLWIAATLGPPVACWNLVAAAIHQESLPGHQQYWLTRPFTWIELAAAKALFVLVFVNLPLFLCHTWVLGSLGFLQEQWPALFWRQLFFTAAYALPAAALAAVTRGLGQLILAVILVYVPAATLWGFLTLSTPSFWDGYDWIRASTAAAIVIVGTTAILLVQYTRRKTALARALVGATVALAVVAATFPPVGGAFAVQSLLSREKVASSAVRISLDPQPGSVPIAREQAWDEPHGVPLEIPVRIDAVPANRTLLSDWTSIVVAAPGAPAWSSGWAASGGVHDLSGGKAWFRIWVDSDFYSQVKDQPVRLEATTDLTMFEPTGTLGATFERQAVPGAGLCIDPPFRLPSRQISCNSAFPRVALAVRTNGELRQPPIAAEKPYAPFPVAGGFRLVESHVLLSLEPSPDDPDAARRALVVIVRPVAHIQRSVEIRGIKLGDFAPQPRPAFTGRSSR